MPFVDKSEDAMPLPRTSEGVAVRFDPPWIERGGHFPELLSGVGAIIGFAILVAALILKRERARILPAAEKLTVSSGATAIIVGRKFSSAITKLAKRMKDEADAR